MSAIEVTIEAVDGKAFASALDWPGWSRAAKTPELAVERLLEYAERYRPVAGLAGSPLAVKLSANVVETAEGDATTAFGAPGRVGVREQEPLDAPEAERRARLVEAAWTTFDRIAAAAPEALRKGPRGGGRDRSKIVTHVVETETQYYTRELGLKPAKVDPGDAAGVAAIRAAMLEVLRRPSDGSPIAKRWTARYAARRIAWHALDHAWEIEDRSEG